MFNKITKDLSGFFSQFIKRYAPAVITLLVIGGAFYFYTNVIIEENERTIRERSYRGLNRIAGNVSQKIQVYGRQNSRYFLRAVRAIPDSSKWSGNNPELQNLQDEYGLKQLPDRDTIRRDDVFAIRYANDWNIVFGSDSAVKVGAAMQDFVKSLLRRDLFPYYFLAHNNRVLFDEVNTSHDSADNIAGGKLVIDSSAKTSTKEYGLMEEVSVGGKKYKLFLTPFTVNAKHHFVIGGYMPLEDYIDEGKYLPGNAILWLVFGIVLVILMFPLLKVFLMTKAEPLLPRNVLTSLMSLHLLGSILIIILVNVYAYYFLIRGNADEQLRTLTKDIQTTFQSEVQAAIDEADSSEAELVKVLRAYYPIKGSNLLPDLYRPVPDLRNYRIAKTGVAKRPETDSNYNATSLGGGYRYFENIAWADSNGRQVIRWTNNNVTPSKLDVRNRDYFQAVMQGSLLRTRRNQEYYFSAVSSWASRQKLAIIARRSRIQELFAQDTVQGRVVREGTNRNLDPVTWKKLYDTLGKIKMISISAPLRSVFNPVLPYGFGFCIVDERGDVQFHYDENRNLSENLVEECNDNVELNSLLNTGAADYFNAHYSGSNYRFYMQPIDRMPYYLVTFYDHENIWNQDLDIVSASSILVLINMGIILLLILVTRMLSLSLLSRTVLFIWIEPKYHRKYAYQKATFGFLAASLLLSVFSLFSNVGDELYLLAITWGYIHLLIAYAYYVYERSDAQRKLRKINYIRPMIIMITLYLIIAVIFLIKLQDGQNPFIWSQVALLLLLGSCLRFLPDKTVYTRDTTYKPYYYLSLFSFILATAIVPTLLFFFLTFKEEQKLAIKYQQLDFVSALLHKKPFTFYQPGADWKLSYDFPFHYNYLADQITRDKDTVKFKKAVTNFGRLYNAIKPSFSSYAKRIEYLNTEDSVNASFDWSNSAGADTLRFRIAVLRTKTFAEGDYRILASKSVPTVFTLLYRQFTRSPLLHILFLLTALLILGGLYALITRLIPRVFFFSRPRTLPLQMIDEKFIDALPRVNHVYVMGITNSGKNSMIKRSYAGYTVHTLDIAWLFAGDATNDCTNTFAAQWKVVTDDLEAIKKDPAELEKRVVVVRHFDMKMNDLAVTEEKLKKLECLLSYKVVKVVIASCRHFENMPLIEEADGKIKKDLSDRWANVMNNFCMFYHRWKPGDTRLAIKKPDTPVYTFDPKLEERFDKECAHSEYLYGLLEPLKRSVYEEWTTWQQTHTADDTVDRDIKDDLFGAFCYKLQTLAHHYYLSLWQSLSGDEQRTLYDIAGDGLMNQRNHDVGDNLFALGLIRINHSETGYKVMNESFRRFVLTRIDKAEISKLHDEADPAHSWNRFQLPVILAVVALSLFLFVTQKDAFNNLVAYLGAAAAAIAGLLKILDVYSAPKTPGS
jgi:hypothetical protein